MTKSEAHLWHHCQHHWKSRLSIIPYPITNPYSTKRRTQENRKQFQGKKNRAQLFRKCCPIGIKKPIVFFAEVIRENDCFDINTWQNRIRDIAPLSSQTRSCDACSRTTRLQKLNWSRFLPSYKIREWCNLSVEKVDRVIFTPSLINLRRFNLYVPLNCRKSRPRIALALWQENQVQIAPLLAVTSSANSQMGLQEQNIPRLNERGSRRDMGDTAVPLTLRQERWNGPIVHVRGLVR